MAVRIFAPVKFLFPIFAFLIVLRPAFPVVEYVLNYDYIATELCENKELVELECNGKCYLMKSLAEAASEESQQNKEQNSKKAEVPLLFFEQKEAETEFSPEELEFQITDHYKNQYSNILIAEFFHPPCS
ncbi:hypothetical protein ML462_11935 [Gramella lutea]|uniref:Uncharacterized protein n=1 Tax=Christiangramia lutea TaxID=1607951 RepID=A0A9X1V3U4_9FLAO|nr:hypothetical protein [Christiangramia lutea]MCH4823882.1 hypothetical protein [Christiangramia lutea]